MLSYGTRYLNVRPQIRVNSSSALCAVLMLSDAYLKHRNITKQCRLANLSQEVTVQQAPCG